MKALHKPRLKLHCDGSMTVLGMNPEEIKAALRMQGVTLAALADEVGVSRSMVTHVIHAHARSAHVMERIAKIIGKPVAAIWAPKPVLRRANPTARVGREAA